MHVECVWIHIVKCSFSLFTTFIDGSNMIDTFLFLISLLKFVMPFVEVYVENYNGPSSKSCHQESERERDLKLEDSQWMLSLLLVMRQSQTSNSRITRGERVKEREVESSPDLSEHLLNGSLLWHLEMILTSTMPLSPPVIMYSPSLETSMACKYHNEVNKLQFDVSY